MTLQMTLRLISLSLPSLLVLTHSQAQASTFTEDILIQNMMSSGLAPLQREIDSLQADEIRNSVDQNYSPQLNIQALTRSSSKDATNSFQPSLAKSYGYGIEASKAWSFGARTKIGFEESYSRLKSSPSDIVAHEPYFFAELNMSLFQNLFGELDRASLLQGDLNQKLTHLQKDLTLHQAIVSSRNLYWSLVANHLSINISKELLKTSQQQLSEIRKRQKSGIAEKSDVLLSQAQVAQRESALMGLQIKQNGIARSIQQKIPSFSAPSDEDYPKFSVETFIDEINSCINLIQTSGSKTPAQYSSYSELLSLISEISDAEVKTSTQGIGPDLNLMLRGESNGVDSRFSEAFSESIQLKKNTWSAGLQLSIPLGSSEYDLRKIRAKKAALMREKQRKEITSMLEATHTSATQSIVYLLKTVQNLEKTTGFLKERIRSVEQKYKQGRVDFLNLVQEQDQLFSAENGLIDSQLLFMHELLNYFAAFDKLPCNFNTLYSKGQAR